MPQLSSETDSLGTATLRLPDPARWITGAAALALLLLLASALNLWNTREQEARDSWVGHTHQVIDELTAAVTHLRAADAAQRYVLMARDESEMSLFDTEVSQGRAALERARQLTADHPSQQQRIARALAGMAMLAGAWRHAAELQAHPATSYPDVREVMAQTGRQVDAVVGQIRQALDIERDLLEQRISRARQAYTVALLTTAATGAGLALFGVAFALLLRRYLARQRADAQALRQLGAALQEADQRKDRFIALLAHELRNPLAPVRTAAAILASPGLDPSRLASVSQVMARQVAHMAALLDDLLDAARITQGKLALHRRQVLLSEVVEAAVEAVRSTVDGKRHALHLSLPAGIVRLDVDPVRLSQVLTNLLGNAAKYTDPGGHLVVVAEVHDRRLSLRVRDDGIGMSAQVLPRVFDMFGQPAACGQSEGGLGIGLALARGVVELHGGTLRASSAGVGQGSEFVVELPEVVVEVAQPPESPPQAPPASRSLDILVVDDNLDAAESMAMLLELCGHHVRVASCGSAALEAVDHGQPDIAFLDIGMPGMDGYALARALRARPASAHMWLVAVTGWGQDEDKLRALDAGFDEHLTKPADPARLQAVLARRMGQQQSRPGSLPATASTAP